MPPVPPIVPLYLTDDCRLKTAVAANVAAASPAFTAAIKIVAFWRLYSSCRRVYPPAILATTLPIEIAEIAAKFAN